MERHSAEGHMTSDRPPRFVAYEMFGEMRPSTESEMAAYREMLRHNRTTLSEVGIFDDGFGNVPPIDIEAIIDADGPMGGRSGGE